MFPPLYKVIIREVYTKAYNYSYRDGYPEVILENIKKRKN
jgi:hypothetical protein